MYALILEPLSDLFRITSSCELQDCLEEQVRDLGFSRFQLRLKASPNADLGSELVIGNYPAQWRETYDQAGFSRIDPIVRHCLQSVLPIIWDDRLYGSLQQSQLRHLGLTHGLQNGVTFALHGPGGQFGTLSLNIATADQAEAEALIRRQWGALALLRDAALHTALRVMKPALHEGPVKLTRREQEVLRWSAVGKTSWEISNICCCSEANVDFHFKNIRRKFGVTTRSAAVVKALAMQLIQV